jgi:Neuraminidase (sialidase)
MPKVFSQDEFVYVVWPMKMPPKLFFLSSSDGGSTWGEPKEIGSIWHSTHLSLTADSNGFVAIIATARTGSLDEGVWLYRSDDFGASWRNPEKIFELGAHTISTDLIKSDGTLHLVWYDLYDPGLNPTLEIFYRNSGDNGDSWNSSVLINDRKEVGAVPSYIGDINPAVDVYKNRIDVSWSECPLSNDSTNDKYLFHRSGDQSGANWGTVTKLDPTLDNGGKPLVKDISSSSSYVHLVSNLGYYLHDINANTWSQQFTARGGRMIDDSEGWVVIVGRDENGMYWIRFPEGQ